MIEKNPVWWYINEIAVIFQRLVIMNKLLAFDLDAGGAFRKIYLCWRKDTILTSLEHKFVRFIQEQQLRSVV